MNKVGLMRMEQWNAGGQKPLKVLTQPVAGVFLGIDYFKGNMVDEFMRQQLRNIDPCFEIVYDRATAGGTLEPAFHLYRRIRGSAGSPERLLQLEFSLQHDCDKPWPQGKPREPGRWVLDEIRKHDKSHLSSDPEIANRRLIKQIHDKDIEDTRKADIESQEPFIELNKELQEVVDGKKGTKGRRNNRRRPREAPAQVCIATPADFKPSEARIAGV